MTSTQEHKGVWVFSESLQITLELLGKGRRFADDLGTELVSLATGKVDPQKLIQHGADKVLVVSNPELNAFQVDTYTDAFEALIVERKPDILLIGATRNGLEFAPRLAERLKTGCVTEAARLELDAEKKLLIMDRVTLGGNLMETQISKSKPQIATVPKGLYSVTPADSARKAEVIKVEPKFKPPSTRLVETKPKTAKGVKLTDAAVIVSFGRGVRKKEDITIVERLATTIGGVVGCSRPIAEDLRWLPEDQYVGLSGQKVNPKLYLALGISGQIQHLTGIRNSRVIVAVNNDPKAPIFEYSDYNIVADLYQVIPALIDAVKQLGKT
ncbi:MAG TPA: electron transfer flavoprotein subunit alpha/FixB family protein [Candidatus Dormibacteraeota bacterium]|nr:electron transfer flavoprotein subunit alpha/FixB family protein [Candidatus Dormibacteraeota bacterium]